MDLNGAWLLFIVCSFRLTLFPLDFCTFSPAKRAQGVNYANNLKHS